MIAKWVNYPLEYKQSAFKQLHDFNNEKKKKHTNSIVGYKTPQHETHGKQIRKGTL